MEPHKFQALLVFGCTFCNGLVQTNVYAYINEMVMDLGMSQDRNATGTYVGILASMFMLGRAFSSPIWGYLADTIGRKASMQLSLFFVALFNLGFGLTSNYWVAVLMRLLLGLGSGISTIGKASATELGPKSYKADAMVWYTLGNNLGLTLGTALGGVMAHFERLVPELPTSLPYLWPNLVISGLGFFVFILLVCYFKETLVQSKENSHESSWSQYGTIIKMKEVQLLTLILLINACMGTAMNELLPLWCWADREHGGLDYSTMQIGFAFSIASLVLIFFQAMFYSALERSFGQVWLTKTSSLIRLPVVLMQVEVDQVGLTMEMTALVTMICLYRLTYVVSETSLFLLTNNAVPDNYRGKFNGLIMSINSAFRAFIPALFGIGFTWSLEGWGFPFDDHFMFYIIFIMALVQWLLSQKLRRHMEVDFEDRSKLL
mmetsp:Transcript_17781/g.32121  ORF Transcript_17781/g.32121 Transcript_17781/m.32121 type:complete len:433 (+) Transcript_17781:14-1312(+)